MFELSFQEWAKQEGYKPVKIVEDKVFYPPEAMQEWRAKSKACYERLEKIDAVRLALIAGVAFDEST